MLMESQVKFHHLQNLSGASQKNSVATFFSRTEVDRDLFSNNWREHKTALCSSSSVIKLSGSLKIQNWFANLLFHFHPFFKQKSSMQLPVQRCPTECCGCKWRLFKSSWDLRASGDVVYAGWTVWSTVTSWFVCEAPGATRPGFPIDMEMSNSWIFMLGWIYPLRLRCI